jgi:small redox-active disulfide protein 2
MNVQVIGPGCASCKKLHEQVLKAVQEIDNNIKVDYITDITKLIELGIMSSPALVINGKVASVGTVPPISKIKEMLNDQTKTDKSPKNCCSCSGKCK